MQYFLISHKNGPTDLLHPYPAPRLKTIKVLLIYFPKCPNLTTIQFCAQSVALH